MTELGSLVRMCTPSMATRTGEFRKKNSFSQGLLSVSDAMLPEMSYSGILMACEMSSASLGLILEFLMVMPSAVTSFSRSNCVAESVPRCTDRPGLRSCAAGSPRSLSRFIVRNKIISHSRLPRLSECVTELMVCLPVLLALITWNSSPLLLRSWLS